VARQLGEASPPNRWRAQRSSPPSAHRDTQPARGVHRRASARAWIRSACGIRQVKCRAARNRPRPARVCSILQHLDHGCQGPLGRARFRAVRAAIQSRGVIDAATRAGDSEPRCHRRGDAGWRFRAAVSSTRAGDLRFPIRPYRGRFRAAVSSTRAGDSESKETAFATTRYGVIVE
jgi:hypothetical protein